MKRLEWIDVVGDHFPRAVIDGVAKQFRAGTALVEADRCQAGQVHQAEHDDHGAHDNRDAEDLLAFDA